MSGLDDPHQLDASAFHRTVHSFEFWFEAVEGYLHGREYGISPTTQDVELSERQRESLITILCAKVRFDRRYS